MDSSTSRLLRGLLEPCLLALLENGADYGLSLTRRLTDAGRAELAARREEWRALRTAFSAVLEGAPPRTHTGDQTRVADGAHA